MADENTKQLVKGNPDRVKTRFIKQLSDGFVLTTENVGAAISWLQLFKNALKVDGLEAGHKVTIPFNNYWLGKDVLTEKKLFSDSNFISNPDDAIFLFDVVSLVSGIREELRLNHVGETDFSQDFRYPEQSYWTSEFGEERDGSISELALLKNYEKIREYIQLTIDHAIKFEESGSKPPIGFIFRADFETLIAQALSQEIASQLSKNPISLSLQALTSEVEKIIATDKKWIIEVINDDSISKLVNLGLSTQRLGDNEFFFKPEALESQIVVDLIAATASTFIQKNGDRFIQIQNQPTTQQETTPTDAEQEADGAEQEGGETQQEVTSEPEEVPEDEDVPVEDDVTPEEPTQEVAIPEGDYFNREQFEAFAISLIFTNITQEIPDFEYVGRYRSNPQIASILTALEFRIQELIRTSQINKKLVENVTSYLQSLDDQPYLVSSDGGQTYEYSRELLNTGWFKRILTQLVVGFVSQNSSIFTDQFISPALELLSQDADVEPEQIQQQEQIAQPQPTPPPPPQPAPEPTTDPAVITQEQRRKIQYESAWLSNRAIFELFTSRGIAIENIDPILLNQLRSETWTMLAGYSEHELAYLFASPSKRQAALIDLYKRLNTPSFLGQLNATYSSYGLGQIPKLDGEKSASPQAGFDAQLSQLLQQDADALSTIGLNTYTRETLESIAITYGVKGVLESQSASDKKDAVWFINNLSAEKILLIFFPQVTDAATKKNITDNLDQIKKLLIGYVRVAASDMVLKAYDERVAEGLGLTEADEQAMAGSVDDFREHFRSSKHITQSVRKDIEKDGAENVAVQMQTNGQKLNKQQQKFEEVYALWLEPWSMLRNYHGLLYEYWNIHIPAGFEPEVDVLPMPTQFIGVSPKEMERILKGGSVRRILGGSKTTILVQEIVTTYEIVEYNLQAGSGLHQRFLSQLGDDAGDIAAQLGVPLEQASVQQLYAAAARLDEEKRSSGLMGKLSDPLKQKAGQKLEQALATKGLNASQLAGKAAVPLAVATFLANAKNREMLVKGMGLLGVILLKALKNMLSSVGGFVGGLGGAIPGAWLGFKAGAAIGTFVGGPVGAAIGGVVGGIVGGIGGAFVGSEIGSHALPRMFGFGGELGPVNLGFQAPLAEGARAGLGASTTTGSATTGAPATTTTAGTAVTASTIATAISSAPIAILAPGIGIIIAVLATVQAIFIIHSSFLAPLPGGDFFGGQTPPLEGFEGCWPTKGFITGYKTYFVDGTSDGVPHATWDGNLFGKQGPGFALDIGTGSVPASEGGPFQPVFSPFSGEAYFYPEGMGIWPTYGHHVVLVTPNFVVIFAHLRDFGGLAPITSVTEMNIVAGTQIGIVDSTGESIGNHLHYEIVGTDVLNVVPLTSVQKAAALADETTLADLNGDGQIKTLADMVKPESCKGATTLPTGEGYIAIGPVFSNVVVSSNEQIQAGAELTCNWRRDQGLKVAVNANFFNTLENGVTQPVGHAGYQTGVFYYQDPDPATTTITKDDLSTFTVAGSLISIAPTTSFPTTPSALIPGLDAAVSGIYSSGPSSSTQKNRRTILGIGTNNGTCSTLYQGEPVIFLAAMESASYDEIEAEIRACGATQVLHLDGGGSTAFCSDEYTLPSTRLVPVSIGLGFADIVPIGASASAVPAPVSP